MSRSFRLSSPFFTPSGPGSVVFLLQSSITPFAWLTGSLSFSLSNSICIFFDASSCVCPLYRVDSRSFDTFISPGALDREKTKQPTQSRPR